MVQQIPMATEPVPTKLTETSLEPIGPLGTKVVQSLVSRSSDDDLYSLTDTCWLVSSWRWAKDVVCRSSWNYNKHSVGTLKKKQDGDAICRENQGVREFYIHYVNFNRRLDKWVKIDRLNLKELAPPSSSSSPSSQICQKMPISSRNTPSRAISSSTASSSEVPPGNTATLFLRQCR